MKGLAYAMLANVPPIYGIYMAFFPVPIYVLLGTSRHISMGSFAVITLMAGKVVIMYQSQMPGKSVPEHMTPNSSASLLEDIRGDPTVQVASVVALTILLWALQMGSVAVFLSDILVSGFTTGAAVHVATSQLKHVFGLAVPRHDGPGKILRTYRDLIPMLVKSNVVSLIISGVNIFVLIVNNDYLKPYLAKKCIFPVPIELICVTIGTLLSYTTEMNKNYNVSVVGYLPNGLPAAQVPPVWLMQDMNFLIQCFIIAIVSYAISISLAKLFARRGGYEIAPNQELLAQAVLAAIILVALRGLFRQVSDLRRAWQVNKLDAFVWLATFLSAVIIDIDFALGIGFAASVFTLILRNQRPKAYLLGHIPETGIYVDIRRYSLAKEEEGIKILRYEAGLNFANRETFMQLVFQLTHLEPAKWKKIVAKYQKNLAAQRGKKAEKVKKGKKGKKGNAELVMQTNGSSEPSATATMEEKMEPQLPFRNLIFDMTGVTAVDASGVITLTRIFTDYTSIGVNVYFVGATGKLTELQNDLEGEQF
ncbi:unnamed protein product [Darwinula stevensoni]|uniref:STAS domain-containing protein n=1 Tax=Darwinula stevensoni TaxID=69355 RepID=A0A7R8X6U8_9CRUS|nr:unnamed protein product [Darwinula stevensoni]CAG0881842.1 unnamed protein product [Darwinula stevensoni]